jgi:hypothetical protein
LVSQQRSVFHVSGLPCYLQSTAWRPNCSLWRPCLGRAVVRVGAGKRCFGRPHCRRALQAPGAPLEAVQPTGVVGVGGVSTAYSTLAAAETVLGGADHSMSSAPGS